MYNATIRINPQTPQLPLVPIWRGLGRAARGEYLYFHDADDWLEPGALRRMAAAAESGGLPDGVAVPFAVLRPGRAQTRPVRAAALEEAAAMTAVGPWSKMFRRRLFEEFPEGCSLHAVAWHFAMWDRCRSYGRVEGPAPCYWWDCTVPGADTRTLEWLAANPRTLPVLAAGRELDAAGLKRRYVSDSLRSLARMYDLIPRLRRPDVRAAALLRLSGAYLGLVRGRHTH